MPLPRPAELSIVVLHSGAPSALLRARRLALTQMVRTWLLLLLLLLC